MVMIYLLVPVYNPKQCLHNCFSVKKKHTLLKYATANNMNVYIVVRIHYNTVSYNDKMLFRSEIKI